MAIPFLKSNRPGVLYAVVVLLVAAIMFGGASRLDVVPPVVVRIIAVGALLHLVWTAPPGSLRLRWNTAALWAAILAVPLIQLVPLPWGVWTALPGREHARAVYEALDSTPWQSISLAPDRTLNGLLALLPALTMFVLGSRLDADGRATIFNLVLILAVISALLGLLQVGGGAGSSFYFYAITNDDSSVGFFANSNHHALFLCAGIVLAFVWLAPSIKSTRQLPLGQIIAAVCAVGVLLLSIAATSSRAGAGLAVLSVVGGYMLLPLQRAGLSRLRVVAMGAVPAVLMGIALVLALNGTILSDRLALSTVRNERITNVPMFAQMTWDFFPFGAGLGSFDPVFRSYETVEMLNFNYLNHAHNDYAQIAIETGLPGIVIVALFLLWWLGAVRRALRPGEEPSRVVRQSRAAAMITCLLLLHSLVDYPLRTAALSVLFALCCAIIAGEAASARGGAAPRKRVSTVEAAQ